MSKKPRQSLKVALVGANGRMGREVAALAGGEAGFTVVERSAKADVVIDFSSPQGLVDALRWCGENRKPLVSGTTGLGSKEIKLLKTTSRQIPVLHSPNMSLGVAVMAKMLEPLAALTDWDFQIDEIHHNQKKDRPSGTALALQERLIHAVKRQLPPPLSTRGGGVPGLHQVWAMGADEVLLLQHTAFNRKIFARGALRAARWLFDKGEPGLYDLSHLLEAF